MIVWMTLMLFVTERLTLTIPQKQGKDMTHKNALFYWALVVSEMTGQIQSCVMFESTTLNVEMFRIIFNYSL